MFYRFVQSKLLTRAVYVNWPTEGVYSSFGTLNRFSMFSPKLIQKKVNARTRDDILASKVAKLETKTGKHTVNKLHSGSQSEEENNKKPTKKRKKKKEIGKRKLEKVSGSNDQNNASKKAKDDNQTFIEDEHSRRLREYNENRKMNKTMNKDFKSKFNRYFQVAPIDSDVDDSEKNSLSLDDNRISVIPKSIQNKINDDNKNKKKGPKNKDIENNNVDKKLRGKSNGDYSFTLDESESSGEEEIVFELRLPDSDDTHLNSEEFDENYEKKSRENHSKVYNFANKIKQVDNVAEVPQKSRHQQRKEAAAAERELQMTEKQSIVGKVLAVEAVSNDKLAVAILPGEKIYFNGTVLVTALVGSVNVLGYTIKVGRSHVVSSPSSQSLLGLSPQDSQQLTPSLEEELHMVACVSQQFINKLKNHKDATTILLLSRCDVSSLNFLKTLDCKSMSLPWFAKGEWINVLDAELITHENYRRYGLVQESEEWIVIMDKLLLDYKQGKRLNVLICGGQRTGKSTLFRYMINSLLNSDCPIKNVHCIDLDPGQPEFSMPTTMSCSTISQPLLEPSFSHQVPKDKINTVVLGTTSPLYVVEEYLSCIKSLVSKNKEASTPQVINTMGWTDGMGLDLMLDTIRIVKPSHIIQIHNPQDPRNNFEELLSSDYVLSSNGGMISQSCSEEDLNYETLEVTAVNKYPVNGQTLKGNTIRDFKVLSEFSHLLENEEKDEMITDIRVPWSIMALHVCGRQVPKENILQVLNASLVALCRIDQSMIVEPPRSDLPKHILFEELISHPAECLGWAVVRGIDPLTQHLHLLTNLTEEEVIQNVNAIIMTQQYLPQELYTYFSQGEGPYLQKNSDDKGTGANASTLGRRKMPRATSRQITQFTVKQTSSQQSTSQNKKFSTESRRYNKNNKPVENLDIVRDKDYYNDSWT